MSKVWRDCGVCGGQHEQPDLLGEWSCHTPPLRYLVSAFCEEIESGEQDVDNKSRGGQHTNGPSSYYERMPPSTRSWIKRWVRDFRKAMERPE